MADSMIRHEQNDRVFQFAFGFKSLHDLANQSIGVPTTIEIRRPVFEQHGIVGIVRWQCYLVSGNGFAENLSALLLKFFRRLNASASAFASGSLNLMKEWLSFIATGPVVSIIDGLLPFKVVVRFAEAPLLR